MMDSKITSSAVLTYFRTDIDCDASTNYADVELMKSHNIALRLENDL